MKKSFYEVVFLVTETMQNGDERQMKKSVLIPHFDEVTGKHIPEEQRIVRGEKALTEEHFYDILYLETKNKTIIFA